MTNQQKQRVEIITAGQLTVGTVITDHDILSDLNEPLPVRVTELRDATDRNGLLGVAVTMVGQQTHTQVWGRNFDLQVRS